ncbi:MAG: SDR family oxidoreductase [Acetobacteraceae bacterium]|nr:SDR family oxidoreductase [Acetobacteraceae bacterium]
MSDSTALRFADQVALVTGGSRGIGLAIAKRLAGDGARVALVARPSEALTKAAASIHGAVAVEADLAQPDPPAQAVAVALNAFGRLDMVVHSAGETRGGDFLALDDTVWEQGFGAKFFGAVRLCRAAWPHLRVRGGRIVLIIGVGGRLARADFAIGGSVNAALMNLTKALAARGIEDGVRVNAVSPGSVRTDRLAGRVAARMRAEPSLTAEQADRALAREAGVTRAGEPHEIAAAVAFLCSTEASYIQGEIVTVDGGFTRAV